MLDATMLSFVRGSLPAPPRRLLEIGLCRGLAESNQPDMPSVELWQNYFPFCHITGVDLTDFSHFRNDRFASYSCDQSQLEQVRSVAAGMEPGWPVQAWEPHVRWVDRAAIPPRSGQLSRYSKNPSNWLPLLARPAPPLPTALARRAASPSSQAQHGW